MANLRSADEEDIMVEMIKHANVTFKEYLLNILNQRLQYRNFDESLYIAILQIIPKDGNVRELAHWRPIALLSIFNNVFSKFVYRRISSHLFQRQSSDQHGFTPGKRIKDVLLCAEVAIEHHQEFNLKLWMISMDTRKGFDIIYHKVLLRAIRSRGIPQEYITLISIPYVNQRATVNHNSEFPAQR